MRLSHYPYVRVRLACTHCNRAGSYRLARLAAKYGAEIELDELVRILASDCASMRSQRLGCAARLVDLDDPPGPPDLPPALVSLRLVKGGRK